MTNQAAGGAPGASGGIEDFFALYQRQPLAGRYLLETPIGRGSAATVYQARDLKHDRAVAVKVLHEELSAAIGAERFAREIALLARLQHPHILPLHDSGNENGVLFFVTPLVAGEPLRARLAREQQLPIADAIRIAREAADALDCAHQQGIIHRDIKPENILLSGGHAMLADFGIALAPQPPQAPARRLTDSGLAVGTPIYMSPEQASGDTVDARSDVYSLGCVLYEMLAGQPPFTGPSSQSVVAQRFTEKAKALRRVRESATRALERIVGTALARVPADRFATARAFAEALAREEAMAAGATPSPAVTHSARRRWFAAGVAATIVLGTLVAMRLRAPEARVDRTLHLVAPCVERAGAAESALGAESCESLLYEALSRWRDLRLVDAFRAHDARDRMAPEIDGIGDGLRLARRLGAGVLAWGEITPEGDSIAVRAALYDVVSGEHIESHTVRIARDLSNAPARFSDLADSLLLRSDSGAGSPPAVLGTRSLEAWRAHEGGERALRAWSLTEADSAFHAAMTADPAFAAPALRRAQVMQWRGDAPAAWHDVIRRALERAEQLSAHDRTIALALLALGEERHAEACTRYEELLRRDSLDFAALIGRGDCNATDPIVVRDARSPSGWSFRGSQHRAIESYRRAVELVPSFHIATRGLALSRLPQVLQVSGPVLRAGVAPDADSLRFYAAMSLTHDTIAFVPYPVRDFGGAARASTTPTTGEALERNRRTLRDVTASWVKAFPSSPYAHEAHGALLEIVGELDARGEQQSAGRSYARARALASARVDRIRLDMSRVRLLLKGERYADARRLADSLLAATSDASPAEADWLKGAAALTGRIALTARLLERSAPEAAVRTTGMRRVDVPPSVLGTARALLGYASFGAPPDSVRALHQRTERLVRQWVEPGSRAPARNALLAMPALLAFPLLGAEPVDQDALRDDYLVAMRDELRRGDSAAVRGRFAALAASRALLRPGDVSIDAAFAESRVLLELADTAAAVAALDASLGAIDGMDDRMLRVVPMTVSLVRAMALRADLAARRGDRVTARRWARPVIELWSGGDAALAPLIAHLRALSGA